jgi:hypothetical protein
MPQDFERSRATIHEREVKGGHGRGIALDFRSALWFYAGNERGAKWAAVMFSLIVVPSLNANYSFKYFGQGKGVSAYSFIDERHFLFHSTVALLLVLI